MRARQTNSNGEKRLLSIDDACTYLSLGKSRTRTFLKDIHAEIHLDGIEKRCLYDKRIIDDYLDKLQETDI